MESALIVTSSEKSVAFFTEMLNTISINHIVTSQTCGQARRLLLEKDFDLVVINSPLRDETGESLARYIASRGTSQVILVVKSEHFEEVSATAGEDGVLTVAKPINRELFWSALKLAKAADSRLKRMRAENSMLKQKIEDIRIIDRAKCILISHFGMSEQKAHRFIEKHAMDIRATKRAVAEGILKMYEN
jgi:AmiR/NasT family two-component response regulator